MEQSENRINDKAVELCRSIPPYEFAGGLGEAEVSGVGVATGVIVGIGDNVGSGFGVGIGVIAGIGVMTGAGVVEGRSVAIGFGVTCATGTLCERAIPNVVPSASNAKRSVFIPLLYPIL